MSYNDQLNLISNFYGIQSSDSFCSSSDFSSYSNSSYSSNYSNNQFYNNSNNYSYIESTKDFSSPYNNQNTSNWNNNWQNVPYYNYETQINCNQYYNDQYYNNYSHQYYNNSQSINENTNTQDYEEIYQKSQTVKTNEKLEKKTKKSETKIIDSKSIQNQIVIEIDLSNKSLWNKFNKHTTEMILTKQGRRMFPTLEFCLKGLETNKKYSVFVDIVPVNSCLWKYQGGKWVPCGEANTNCNMSSVYMHPDSPNSGSFWMKNEIVFSKLKLTNNRSNPDGHILLNSMQKYIPRLHIALLNDPKNPTDLKVIKTIFFEETEFIAVTAYQNTYVSSKLIFKRQFKI